MPTCGYVFVCLHEHENFHFIRIDWKHQHEIDIRKANTTNAKVFASKNKHSNTQRKHSPFVRYRQIRSLNLKISENHHRCRRQITTWNKNCRDLGAQEKLALSRMVWAMKKVERVIVANISVDNWNFDMDMRMKGIHHGTLVPYWL